MLNILFVPAQYFNNFIALLVCVCNLCLSLAWSFWFGGGEAFRSSSEAAWVLVLSVAPGNSPAKYARGNNVSSSWRGGRCKACLQPIFQYWDPKIATKTWGSSTCFEIELSGSIFKLVHSSRSSCSRFGKCFRHASSKWNSLVCPTNIRIWPIWISRSARRWHMHEKAQEDTRMLKLFWLGYPRRKN